MPRTFGLVIAAMTAGLCTAVQAEPTWSSAAKTGIGTAYEAYSRAPDGSPSYSDRGRTGPISRVWFSIADGTLTETQYGLIHETQLKSLKVAVSTGGRTLVEGRDMTSHTSFLHTDEAGRPLSPAYRVTSRDAEGRVEIEKHIFTDPDRQSLFLRIIVRPLKGRVTPLLVVEPAVGNTVGGETARVGADALSAFEGKVAMSLVGARPFRAVAISDQGQDIALEALAKEALGAGKSVGGHFPGGLVLAARLGASSGGVQVFDLALGFGSDVAGSRGEARATLLTGHDEVLARFNGEGRRTGWEDYMAGLTELPRLRAQSGDKGRLLQASALMLKVQEDHTYPGALIASLSNPWGEDSSALAPSTGYKAVWPRDFYQCAMALAALGDRATPVAAFAYLPRVQVSATTPGNRGGAGGWFLQKSHVDGTPEWVGVQLDQTAMPIMLGWKLWKLGWISKQALHQAYGSMMKPAADFLASGGKVAIDWNTATITPPFTQQERWEEQAGYSPSTTAAVIAGLTTAADIARQLGDPAAAESYLKAADADSALIEKKMFTRTGRFGDGRYFLRVNTDEDPDNHSPVLVQNSQPAVAEDEMVDAGFLELVRYGVRRADDPYILASLPELDDEAVDDLHRVKFSLPGGGGLREGWRRYGVDGYGEDQGDGAGYGAGGKTHPAGRGRVWPLLTGERGHYELARLLTSPAPRPNAFNAIRRRYAGAMEAFSNDGLLLPEQVWDGIGASGGKGYQPGQGTDSATPLAWSHAEYVKLLRSFADLQVWDRYSIVEARFASSAPRISSRTLPAEPGP